MVPPEEACGDEVGNDYIYGVVIMSKKDAEHANSAERPTPPVMAPEASRRVCDTVKPRNLNSEIQNQWNRTCFYFYQKKKMTVLWRDSNLCFLLNT